MATENQDNRSKKERMWDRLSKSKPDLNMEDEEAVYGSIYDDYDHFEGENKRLSDENEEYKQREKQFGDWITSGEHNGEYFEGMMNGDDVFETATMIHGYDALLEYLQSEEARKKYKKANEEFEKRKAENKKLEEESQANLENTNNELAAAVSDGRFTEEQAKEAIIGLFDICDGLNVKVCKPEWVEMWIKAKSHDADVDAARKEGREEGVNEGIDRQIQQRRANRGQNRPSMPVGAGGSGGKRSGGDGGSLASMLMSGE